MIAGPKTGSSTAGRRLLLLGVLLLGLLVRLPGLTEYGFGIDEGLTAAEALCLEHDHAWRYWEIETERLSPWSGSIPVSYYLAAAGMSAFGESLAGLRIPFVAIGVLVVLLTWLAAHDLTGSVRTAALAALFVALTPAHVEYSQTARFYTPATAALLLWALSLRALVRRPGLVAGMALAAVTAVAYLTHLSLFFLPVIAALWLLRAPWSGEPDGPSGPRVLAWAAIAFFVSVPPLARGAVEILTDAPGGSAEGLLRSLERFLGDGLLRLEIPVAALAFAGAWLVVRRRGPGGRLLLLLSFGLGFLVLALSLSERARGRYAIVCLPWFAVLGAFAVHRLALVRPRTAAVIALAVVVWLGASTADYHRHANGRLAAARAGAAARRRAGDDPVVIVGGPRYGDALFLAGWDPARTISLGPRGLRRIRDNLGARLEGRLVLLVSEAAERRVRKKCDFLDDPRLSRRERIPIETRRIRSYYDVWEWNPG